MSMPFAGDLPYYIRRPAQSKPDPLHLPRVSICIPTRNRVRTIEACLRSIRSQDYPELELIIVDNESTDDTATIAARYADLMLTSPGPLGRVRQTSIERATGSVLAILDDDIVMPHRRWLRNAVQLFNAGAQVSTVWPQLVPPEGSSLITRGFFALNDAIFEDRATSGRGVFGGGNSLFLREAVASVGGFDVTADFGEDMILAGRLKEAGYRVVYCADPLIHDTMYSLREIYRKQRWGAGAVRSSGWALMRQTRRDLVHEQVVIGMRGFARGLVAEHNPSWLAYPLLIAVKGLAYATTLLPNGLWRRRS